MIVFKVMTINIKWCSQAVVHVKQSHLLLGSHWWRLDPSWNLIDVTLKVIIDVTLKVILEACSTETSQINQLNALLILLTLALVIGPI